MTTSIQSRDKVSAICAVMNRTEILKVSIHSWIQNKNIDEFIIVDWSSTPPIPDLEKLDQRIKIIRVNGKKKWRLTKAYNLALHNASNEIIMKLDADYILNPYFNIFDYLELKKGEFINAEWFPLNSIDNGAGFMRFLNGFLYVRKDDLNKIGGWNEAIENYGYDDRDCYLRLEDSGLKKKILEMNKDELFIYHNPHLDKKRYENCPKQKCCIKENSEKFTVQT